MTRPTENEVQEALAVITQAYYADVKDVADDYRSRKQYALDHGDAFEPSDALHECVDASARVIYTYQAKLGLLVSDNEDAYQEEMGEPPATVEAQMFMALYHDVVDYLKREGEEI